MEHLPAVTHRVAHGLCIVNGIRDLIHWRTGRDWSNEFVYGLGQGSGFAYIRSRAANPPRQVYWGVATPRQHEYLAQLLGAVYTVVENRTFKFTWKKAQEAMQAGTPPILGPLDMYHLPYFEHIYHKWHIPIHYVLLVGGGDRDARVYDTDMETVQTVPLDELEQAWNVNIPAMGRKNRLTIIDIPAKPVPGEALVHRSIEDKCRTMLHPPVNMLGIPGMKKLAREITHWPQELGNETTAACLRQAREYLNTPPDIRGGHLTATRDLYITFLEEAAPLLGLDFTKPVALLQESMRIIPQISHAFQCDNLEEAAKYLDQIAGIETRAYADLSEMVT